MQLTSTKTNTQIKCSWICTNETKPKQISTTHENWGLELVYWKWRVNLNHSKAAKTELIKRNEENQYRKRRDWLWYQEDWSRRRECERGPHWAWDQERRRLGGAPELQARRSAAAPRLCRRWRCGGAQPLSDWTRRLRLWSCCCVTSASASSLFDQTQIIREREVRVL